MCGSARSASASAVRPWIPPFFGSSQPKILLSTSRPHRPAWDNGAPDRTLKPVARLSDGSVGEQSMLLARPQLRDVLRKVLAGIRNALVRMNKAQEVVATAQRAASDVERQADARLDNNPVLNAVDRDRHNPRAGVTDAIGVLVDMMDQIAVEAQIAGKTLAAHAGTLKQLERVLGGHASACLKYAAELDARLRSEKSAPPLRETQAVRGLEVDPRQAAVQRRVCRAKQAVEDTRVACQAAVDASQDRMAKCTASKAVMAQANYKRKSEHAPRPIGCPERPLEYSWSADITFALSWDEVGPSRPTWGRPFAASKLSSALKGQTRFSREQLGEMGLFTPATGITPLRRYHYVKAGVSYFRPTASVLAKEHGDDTVAEAWQAPTTATGPSALPLGRTSLLAKRHAPSPQRPRPHFVVVPSSPPAAAELEAATASSPPDDQRKETQEPVDA